MKKLLLICIFLVLVCCSPEPDDHEFTPEVRYYYEKIYNICYSRITDGTYSNPKTHWTEVQCDKIGDSYDVNNLPRLYVRHHNRK